MLQSFDEFLASSRTTIPLIGFIVNLFLTALLAGVLHWCYIRFGNSLSNRKTFGKMFLPLAMITMLIITIVKSSLALSLGLVGALSIIRFRTAIKEPEELIYLFFAISIGLGFGANQGVITIVAFLLILIFLIISKKITRNISIQNNMHLTINSNGESKATIKSVVSVLENNCIYVDLKRIDETIDSIEASFTIELKNISQLDEMKTALKKLDDKIKITLLDNRGLI